MTESHAILAGVDGNWRVVSGQAGNEEQTGEE